MKKKFIIGLSCLCFLFAITGEVLAKGQSSGKKAVKEYYDAWYAMNAQKAYDTLAQADKDEMTLEQFTRNYGFNSFDERLVRSKSTYKIVSVKEKGDRPAAEVKFFMPDNSVMIERIYAIMASFKSPNMTDAQLEEALLKQLKKEKIPNLEMTATVKLIKDKEGWHVFYDWATEKQVNELLSKANSAYYSGDAVSALAAYDMVLQLDPGSRPAAEGRAKVVEAAKQMEADLAFAREYIEIANLVAQNKEIYGEIQPVVTFTIKNNSDKTLNELQLKVSYLDAGGQVLNESTYNIMGGFISRNVKPGEEYSPHVNYYPREVKGWLDKWAEGSIKLEITQVKFKD